MSRALEQDYIGLAEKPSMDGGSDKLSSSSSSSSSVDGKTSSLNLKETELRLGLPGCKSPERKSGPGLCLFGRELQNKHNVCSVATPLKAGAKRGFSDAIDTSSGKRGSSVTDGSQGAALFSPKGGIVGKPLIALDTQTNNSHANTSIKEVGAVPQSAKPVQEKNDQVAAANGHANASDAKYVYLHPSCVFLLFLCFPIHMFTFCLKEFELHVLVLLI